jgi:hypothetical protein
VCSTVPGQAVDNATLVLELGLDQLYHILAGTGRLLGLHRVLQVGTVETLHKPEKWEIKNKINWCTGWDSDLASSERYPIQRFTNGSTEERVGQTHWSSYLGLQISTCLITNARKIQARPAKVKM